jgi:predicted RNA methylase
LLGLENNSQKTNLYIGCGSGIFAIAARTLGAKSVSGWDISNESISTSKNNMKKFGVEDINFSQKDILSESNETGKKYDVVYSWGVLHHTGNMWPAIKNAMTFVKKEGVFCIAIYNSHWSSALWSVIKWFYNHAPGFVQKIMVYFFCAVIYVAKFIVTGTNPLKMNRGMNFYFDVVDWIGGYPYEHASKEQIVEFFEQNGFVLKRFVKAQVGTGCNEFVFTRV